MEGARKGAVEGAGKGSGKGSGRGKERAVGHLRPQSVKLLPGRHELSELPQLDHTVVVGVAHLETGSALGLSQVPLGERGGRQPLLQREAADRPQRKGTVF